MTKMGLTKLSIFLWCTSLLISCGGGGSDGDTKSGCDALHAKIYGGETCDQNAQTPVVAVFPIASDGEKYAPAGICTGTLVTVDDIVTSGHCIMEPLQLYGNAIVAFVVAVGGYDGEVIPVSKIAVHPYYDSQTGSAYDIAMMTLARVPNPAIGPLPVIKSRITGAGDLATDFVYGTDSHGEIGVLRAVDVLIENVSAGNLTATLGNSDGSICQGDSGGPLIVKTESGNALGGVNSWGSSTAGQCASGGADIFGFTNIQNPTILEFMTSYAPDITVW